MINKLKLFLKRDLIKVFSINAIATFIRMVAGFISLKIVSILIGPAGVALVGQLNNFSTIIQVLSTGGINNGLIKYIAENKDSKNEITKYLRTGVFITFTLTIILSFLLIIFSKKLSVIILKDIRFYLVFILFGVTIPFFACSSILLSIASGFKEFKKYAFVNTIGSFISLIFSIFLSLKFGLYGALISVVTYQSIVVIVAYFIFKNLYWFSPNYLIGWFNLKILKKLSNFSLMAIFSNLTLPLSQLVLRSIIANKINLDYAGIWEGMNKISSTYLSIITTSLSVYYLPRLSEINSTKELRKEVISVFKLILPLLILVSLVIFFSKNLIIKMLFTKDFVLMKELFVYQLIGDFFKISSWILAFQMLAKSLTKTYIFTEMFFAITLISTTYLFIQYFGNIGATLSYTISYIIYFLLMVIIFRSQLFKKK